jgi:cytochrome c556
MRSAGMVLGAAAKKGDPEGVKTGFDMLKKSCGGCHSAARGKY